MIYSQQKGLVDLYVLLDANDTEVDWEAVSQFILAWKISVGSLDICHSDHLTVSKDELHLLLEHSRLLVSDRLDYKEVCSRCDVPFIFIDEYARIEKIKEWVNGVWDTRTGKLTNRGDSDLEHLGNVHIETD